MELEELAKEYEKQYKILTAKVEGLKPLLCIYSGEDKLLLRKKIKTYYDMALECKQIFNLLTSYYEEG